MAETIGYPIVYLDTNVFINLMEGVQEISEPARPLFSALRSKPGAAVTSELMLAEVLAPSQSGLPLHIKRRMYLNLIVWSRFITLIPVRKDVLYETADVGAALMRKKRKLKLADAIHLVTAIKSDCRYFVSWDKGIPTHSGMIKLVPDRDGVSQVLEALA